MNSNLTDQTYFDANAGESLDQDSKDVVHRCLFGDGDLAAQFTIEDDLMGFYDLISNLTDPVDVMVDQDGIIQAMQTETEPGITNA